MANLTANTFIRSHGRGMTSVTESWPVTNALQLYAGSLVFVDQATGLVVKPADTATFRFLGMCVESKLGDTAATPRVEVGVNTEGMTLENVDVVGLDNVNDVGDYVFIATTDNPNDLTLTATANTKAIGVLTRYYASGTKGDVRLFTPAEYATIQA